MADIFNNIKKLEQRRGTTYQMRRPFLINPLDGQVYIGPEGGDHSDIYPRVGINVDWIRGYYLTPLKALTWWDEPVSQSSKDAAINAFEVHRMRVEDSHFPFYLMKDALNLVIQGRKREVAALVRSAKRTMTRHDMWARNIGLRYDYDEDTGEYMTLREALIEAILEEIYR